MTRRENIERALAHLRMAMQHLEDAEMADTSPYDVSGVLRLIRKEHLGHRPTSNTLRD